MKQQFFTLLFLLSLMSINAQTSSIYELNEEEHFVVLLDGSLLKADNNDYSTKKTLGFIRYFRPDGSKIRFSDNIRYTRNEKGIFGNDSGRKAERLEVGRLDI